MRLLVVEDEEDLAEGLRVGLARTGYAVDVAVDAAEAYDRLTVNEYDLMLLDVNLPDGDGFSLCRSLRSGEVDTPGDGDLRVLMLTARGGLDDRVRGLDEGADDYLVKPFSLAELLARLRALLRRSGWEDHRRTLRFDDLELDPHAHEVRRGERQIELTRTEFLLLELFLHHPRQVLTREQIFERVWGYDFGPASNSLEVYVGYLRRKTEAAGEARLLHTVRGVGYVLRAARA
jgi:two-component system response regulator MprA